MYSLLSVLSGAMLCLLIFGLSFVPSSTLAETDDTENALDLVKQKRLDRDANDEALDAPQDQDSRLGRRSQSDLDPLDLEVLERALQQGISDVIKSNSSSVGRENDDELERALRRELAEIVRTSGVSDPDVLLDMSIASRRSKITPARGGSTL